MKIALAFLTAAFLVASAAAPAAPKKPPPPPPPTVEAGGQNCIAWEFVRNVRGVFDSSYVQFSNKCPASVSFFWCKSQVFSPGSYPPCEVQRGVYNSTTAPAGWTNRVSASVDSRVVVAIRECPAGYTARSKTDGKLLCRL
jgi:hypothetical protein